MCALETYDAAATPSLNQADQCVARWQSLEAT
jgi:hypothetical protein